MKKLSYTIFSLLMATIMMFSSCRKNENKIDIPVGTENITFYASFENGAKTYLDGKTVKWDADDMINVNHYDFAVKENGLSLENTRAKFESPMPLNPQFYLSEHYMAAYGKGEDGNRAFVNTMNGEGGAMVPVDVRFKIPSDQSSYNEINQEEHTLLKCIPMVAYSDSRNLQFKNMVNIIKVNLKSAVYGEYVNVSAVTISGANDDNHNLYGTFTVTPPSSYPGDPVPGAAQKEQYSSNVIRAEKGLALIHDSYKSVYFIVPVTTAEDNEITIRIEGAAGEFVVNKTLKNTNLRNQIYSINLDVELKVTYRFTVANLPEVGSKCVEFSPGILKYTKPMREGEGTYHFEMNTYSGYGYQLISPPESFWLGKVTHFYWSNNADLAVNGPSNTASNVLFTNQTLTTANPDFEVEGEKGVWRSLSKDEMLYLLTERSFATSKCGRVKVDNQYEGFAILPDNYDYSGYSPLSLYGITGNVTDITYSNWIDYERHGAIFLPTFGYRQKNGESEVFTEKTKGFLMLSDYASYTQVIPGDPPTITEGCSGNGFFWDNNNNGSNDDLKNIDWVYGGIIRLVKDIPSHVRNNE